MMSDLSTNSGNSVKLGASADVSHVPPSNAAGAEASASIGAVAFQCPPFWVSNPRAWFLHLESAFALKGITRQLVKYHHVVSALPQAVTEEVLDILENIPSEAPYDILKTAIVKRTTSSDKERIRKLFHDTQLGDQKPSQLLRRMRSLVAIPRMRRSLGSFGLRNFLNQLPPLLPRPNAYLWMKSPTWLTLLWSIGAPFSPRKLPHATKLLHLHQPTLPPPVSLP